MKISIIGAGNVGSLTAMRLSQEAVGDVVLIDVVQGVAEGKCLDLEDARAILKHNYCIEGSHDINKIKDSEIVVITAGLARRPGMTREELISKNAQILREVSLNIKELCPQAVVIVVTNPLDLMTYLVLKATGFKPSKVFGMGVSLDAARFANLIAKELNIASCDIETTVIGSHGEGMLPLPRFTFVKGARLNEILDDKKIEFLIERTYKRGLEILTLLGSGSAYFAPSLAAAVLVKAVAFDEKRTFGVCAYLDGEYGLKDICIGVPCLLGKDGAEKIIELDLNREEKDKLDKSADAIQKLILQLPLE
ncbi:MAG: malate dehydrogenase [Candidatus Omnitrophota bacterium]|nr:malate dehydrogenase [Candidatus Omnitrophota bacterium]